MATGKSARPTGKGNAVDRETEIESWINSLQDETLREIARLKWAGFADWDIATRMDLAPRTVERKVALLRRMWRERSGRVPSETVPEQGTS